MEQQDKIYKASGKFWAVDPLPSGHTDIFRCSCCRYVVTLPYMQRQCNYKFCPYCGALMED